jgi:hypothetical protein
MVWPRPKLHRKSLHGLLFRLHALAGGNSLWTLC